MRVAFHLGAHCTDDDQILRCLRKNTAVLGAQGIVVPAATRFRPVLRESLKMLEGRPASAAMQQLMLDAIMDEDEAERLVLCNDNFLSIPSRAMMGGQFYPSADEKVIKLANLFPDSSVEFCLTLRNPATLIPTLFKRSMAEDVADFVASSDPGQLRWAELVHRIRAVYPEALLTVWCNEDTPMIWPEVLQAVSGHDRHTALVGLNDFLSAIMPPAAVARMETYLANHPPTCEADRRRVLFAYLEKFADSAALEMELDVPGWSDPYVAALTEAYAKDVDTVAQIPGVRFLSA